jgi:hypothetical protein
LFPLREVRRLSVVGAPGNIMPSEENSAYRTKLTSYRRMLRRTTDAAEREHITELMAEEIRRSISSGKQAAK